MISALIRIQATHETAAPALKSENEVGAHPLQILIVPPNKQLTTMHQQQTSPGSFTQSEHARSSLPCSTFPFVYQNTVSPVAADVAAVHKVRSYLTSHGKRAFSVTLARWMESKKDSNLDRVPAPSQAPRRRHERPPFRWLDVRDVMCLSYLFPCAARAKVPPRRADRAERLVARLFKRCPKVGGRSVASRFPGLPPRARAAVARGRGRLG